MAVLEHPVRCITIGYIMKYIKYIGVLYCFKFRNHSKKIMKIISIVKKQNTVNGKTISFKITL